MQRRALLAILWLSVCAVRAEPALVQVSPNGARALFTTQVLSPGEQVWVQFPKSNGRAACCMKLNVLTRLPDSPQVTDQLNEDHVYAYRLPALNGRDGMAFVGGAWTGQLTGRIQTLLPTVCTSHEGAHLLVLQRGRPKAHLYMDFGYAVQPTCDDKLLARFE